jgi:hypothetical protein
MDMLYLSASTYEFLRLQYLLHTIQVVTEKDDDILDTCSMDQNKEKLLTIICTKTLCFRVRGSLMRSGASCVTLQGGHCEHLL